LDGQRTVEQSEDGTKDNPAKRHEGNLAGGRLRCPRARVSLGQLSTLYRMWGAGGKRALVPLKMLLTATRGIRSFRGRATNLSNGILAKVGTAASSSANSMLGNSIRKRR